MKETSTLCILGAGGFAFDTIACFYDDLVDYKVLFVLDDKISFENFSYRDIKIVYAGKIEENLKQFDEVVIPFGDNDLRKRYFDLCKSMNLRILSLVSSQAILGISVVISEGVLVFPGSFIGSNCRIGEGVIVQLNSVVGHDSTVGSFSRVDCGSVIVGGSSVGNLCYIHSNAVVGHNVNIANSSKLSACSFGHRSTQSGDVVFTNSKYVRN